MFLTTAEIRSPLLQSLRVAVALWSRAFPLPQSWVKAACAAVWPLRRPLRLCSKSLAARVGKLSIPAADCADGRWIVITEKMNRSGRGDLWGDHVGRLLSMPMPTQESSDDVSAFRV